MVHAPSFPMARAAVRSLVLMCSLVLDAVTWCHTKSQAALLWLGTDACVDGRAASVGSVPCVGSAHPEGSIHSGHGSLLLVSNLQPFPSCLMETK